MGPKAFSLTMPREVAKVLGAIFFFVASQTMVWVLVPIVANGLGLGSAFIGVVLAIPALVVILASIPVAALSDRVGRRPSFVAGAALAVTAPTVLALGGIGYVPLLIGVGLFALSGAFFFGPALAYLSEICGPQDHARIQGLNGGLQGLSVVIGSILAGVITDSAGFVVALIIAATLGCATLLLVSLSKPSKTRLADWRPSIRETCAAYTSAINLLRSRSQIQMATSLDIIYIVVVMVVGTSFLTLFATSQLQLSLSIVGLMLGLRSLVGIATSWLFGPSVKRFGLFSVAFASTAVGSVALLLTPWCPNTISLVLLVAIQGLGFGMNAATFNTLVAADTRSTERAMSFAAGGMVGSSGGVLVPPLLGLAAQTLGLGSVFVLGGVVSGVCLSAFVLLGHRYNYVLALEPLGD